MRRTRDELAMAQAWLMSEQGTCPTLQVGCVFTKEGRTLVSGYNGAPAGLPHCSHREWIDDGSSIPEWLLDFLLTREAQAAERGVKFHWPDRTPGKVFRLSDQELTVTFDQTSRPTCSTAEHAERNAIAWAARHGIALLGSTCAVTHMPCSPCAMSLINAGVDRVIYDHPYRIETGVQLLMQAGIVVDQLNSVR